MAQKKPNHFKSLESLEPIEDVVKEASAALDDKNRTIAQSRMPKVLAVANGAGANSAASFSAIYYVAAEKPGAVKPSSGAAAHETPKKASPHAAFAKGAKNTLTVLYALSPYGSLTMGISAARMHKLLRQEKGRLLTTLIEKRCAIAAAIEEESDAAQERAAYLNSLNILLEKAIVELKVSLGLE